VHTGFWYELLRKKRPSGVSRPGSKDNIKVDLQEIGWEDVDCINLTPDTDK